MIGTKILSHIKRVTKPTFFYYLFLDQLSRIRPNLIKRTTGPLLKDLLDELQALSPPVISSGEAEEILQRSSVVRDQVTSLTDVVLKKGDKACGILLSLLKQLDSYLYQDLGLDAATDMGKQDAISRPQAEGEEKPSLKQTLQSITRKKFVLISQDLQKGKKIKLQEIFTDLCIIEGTGGVNDAHELSAMRVRLDETKTTSANMNTVKLSNIFLDHYHTGEPVKKVLTLGIAGVGKTVAVQKFALDWAEETENQNIDLIFVLPFRELNMCAAKDYSLFDLLLKFYPDCDELTKTIESKKKLILFVFDGLDESRLNLDFEMSISDPTKESPVAVLITSLITGKLMPSALIWVTTRPAAANENLQDLFDLVTEIQGFSERQREEYFERVIPEKAEQIITYLKSKRSLYIMCHVPVFCRIIATVLGGNQKKQCVSGQEMPKTLTEMYARYSVLQIRRMNDKYFEEETKMSAQEKGELLIKLGELAFSYLEKDTLIFYKKDLIECGIEVESGALQAGLCTQIFKEEFAESGESMFSFVHLSVQEFLAALYMLHMHAIGQTNLFIKTYFQKIGWWFNKSRFNLYKVCLKRALLSENGHLDLFVRFLLGLAPLLEPNIRYPLDVVLPHLSKNVKEGSITKTIGYIKRQIIKNSSPERIINLFHCLNELGDNSLVEEIDRYMSSSGEKKLTPAQCSTLAYLLLMSAEVLEKFDLKKYLRSEEGLHRMLPVVSSSQRVWLDRCSLFKSSCKMMASTLQGVHSNLRELDMSDNDLQDVGVELLCEGLKAPQCKLATLRLSGCLISEKGCTFLAAALTSNPSHLQELDLSYNHPGESGLKLLSARLEDPHCKLETLKYVHFFRLSQFDTACRTKL
ncbi:hypothetical protein ACEWY4_027780 [Coilia grayii]|uniref:NACHT domain-containing protein n=1 Tax=Coilia grayii TaxID=363190 RepID=A0ABD1IP54_9TELE